MTAAEFSALLLLATAMSFTPGPNTTLSTALAANFGLRRALRFVLAVPVGWSLLLVACALGLGALVTQWPPLRAAIQWGGLAYLLWMAWGLARRATLGSSVSGGFEVGFWQGVLLQFVNIKAWMLALTISAGWIASQPPIAPRLAIVVPVMAAFALASNLTYALIGSALRGWLAQGRRLLWFNRALAAVLVATALWMATL
jgi:threonine/homoserine/homoserine lactone efflux protein